VPLGPLSIADDVGRVLWCDSGRSRGTAESWAWCDLDRLAERAAARAYRGGVDPRRWAAVNALPPRIGGRPGP
jgi:hypothetical protein